MPSPATTSSSVSASGTTGASGAVAAPGAVSSGGGGKSGGGGGGGGRSGGRGGGGGGSTIETPGVGVAARGAGPFTMPVTSTMAVPPTRAKRMVAVARCSRSPTVVPVQVVVNGGNCGTGAQRTLSTPAVVGRKMRGVLPGATPPGPVAVAVNRPEPVFVQVPVACPVIVQMPPITVVQAADWPLSGGAGWAGTTMAVAG